MSEYISQSVKFEGGSLEGRMADVRFPLPFYRGMKINVSGETYVVRNGPIAEAIERRQTPIEHGMILLLAFDSMSQDEKTDRDNFVKDAAHERD